MDQLILAQRLARTREAMRSHDVDCLPLFNVEEASGKNVRYLTGFTGTTCMCLVTLDANVLLTDRRYGIQVRQESVGWDIRIIEPPVSYSDAFLDILRGLSPRRIGLMADETFWGRERWIREGIAGVELVPLPNIVRMLRAVKDDEEINVIRDAIRLMEEILVSLYPKIVPERTTDCDLARELKVELVKRGSEVAFPPIVLSGPDSALIHGNPFKLRKERERNRVLPAEKVIHPGDIIQFDVGCLVDGYASDISRVLVVGRATNRQKKMHEAVSNAITSASRLYRSGLGGSEADAEATRVLKEYGFPGMVHGLGHGIGFDVHELPITNRHFILQVGNVLSCEPGVYEEGYGGMRIERDVLITGEGPVFLDELTTELVEI